MTIEKPMHDLVEKMQAQIKPPRLIPVHEWIYENRNLPSSYAAEPGAMDIAGRTPYLIEICNACANNDTRRVIMRTSAQIGKSELINSLMFYFAALAPAPGMLVMPTKEFAKTYSKEKIAPAILESPKIKKLFYGTKTKGTMLQYYFQGGFIKLVGSNVPADLASSAIRFLFMDEVDRFARTAGEEGDPMEVARNRTKTYSHNYKEIITSTPTVMDAPITKNFLEGTQEHYWVPCPHCSSMQKLIFDQLKWDKLSNKRPDLKTVHYECISCKESILPHCQPRMIKHGEWRAENPSAGPITRSFQLNQLYSPFAPWSRTVLEFDAASRGGSDLMRVFMNTVLGQPFARKVETPSWESVYNKREEYTTSHKINASIAVIVCGIDVQKNYVKAEVYGIGQGLEAWHIDEHVIDGRFDDPNVQNRLVKLIDSRYQTEDGRTLDIARTWMDVGYNTEEVYDWIQSMGYPQTKVVAGVGRGKRQVGNVIVYPNPKNKRQIYTANVDVFKENLFYRLGRLKKEGKNPGYVHYGNMSIEFFKELCSETLITTYNKKTGRLESYWEVIATNGRNEVLDCTVYALGALVEILGLKKWSDDDWDASIKTGLMQEKIKKDSRRPANNRGTPHQSSHWGNNQGSHWD